MQKPGGIIALLDEAWYVCIRIVTSPILFFFLFSHFLVSWNVFILISCSMFPRSTHGTFAEKLYQTFRDHKRFSKPKLSPTDFTIHHYAGDVCTYNTSTQNMAQIDFVESELSHILVFLWQRIVWFQVTYQTEHFLDKNKDYVVPEQQALLSASRCTFISGLFPPLREESAKSSKFSSIGFQFKVSYLLVEFSVWSSSFVDIV